MPPVATSPLTVNTPLCASLAHFTLHAATRAGSHDLAGREALLRYALRPPLAKNRLERTSLLRRLAASVPPPRLHTVRTPEPAEPDKAEPKRRRGSGRGAPWAELMMRTFAIEVLERPKCKGRMRLLATVTERAAIRRFLTGVGELASVPERSPSRGPPYWKSTVLGRRATGDAA